MTSLVEWRRIAANTFRACIGNKVLGDVSVVSKWRTSKEFLFEVWCPVGPTHTYRSWHRNIAEAKNGFLGFYLELLKSPCAEGLKKEDFIK